MSRSKPFLTAQPIPRILELAHPPCSRTDETKVQPGRVEVQGLDDGHE